MRGLSIADQTDHPAYLMGKGTESRWGTESAVLAGLWWWSRYMTWYQWAVRCLVLPMHIRRINGGPCSATPMHIQRIQWDYS